MTPEQLSACHEKNPGFDNAQCAAEHYIEANLHGADAKEKRSAIKAAKIAYEKTGVVHDKEMPYVRAGIVVGCIIIFVIIDLFCCVSGKLPANEPYYLLKSDVEKAQELKVAEEAKRLKLESLTAVIREETENHIAKQYKRTVKRVEHVRELKT